jgi:hypothetical protein
MPNDLRTRTSTMRKFTDIDLTKYYNFEYLPEQRGYKVTVKNLGLKEYPDLPDNYKNRPIVSLQGCFAGCYNLTKPPRLPNDCKDYSYAFNQCVKLRTIPTVPNGKENINVEGMFANCNSLAQSHIQKATENTKVIVADIAHSGLVKNVRELELKNIAFMFGDDVNKKTTGFQGRAYLDIDSLLDIINAETVDGIIEVGETQIQFDDFALDTTLCIIASESYSGGKNLTNLLSVNIDPFKLNGVMNTDRYGLVRLCNQLTCTVSKDQAIPAFLTIEQNQLYRRMGLAEEDHRVEDRRIKLTPASGNGPDNR